MYTKTENGAVVFDSTGHTLLDLNFNALGMRKKDPATIVSIFAKAYEEDPLLAVRWLFYAGDIRQGMGERRLFRTILPYVAKRHPHVLQFVGEYNRFDSLLPLLDDSELGPVVAGLLKTQILADLENVKIGKPISLLGKWLPSINASSTKTRHYARIISTALFDNHNHCAAFKNKIISFSGIPKFIDADGSTVADNINRIMRRGNRGYNTDIMKVFELYLSTIVGAGIPTDAVLPILVIFSDMEFDREAPGNMGFRNEDPTLFNAIRRKFNHHGYELPRLVLWNLASRNGGAPMRTNKAGIVMISGLNQATMDMVFCDKTDPFEILRDKLNSERYNQIKLEG